MRFEKKCKRYRDKCRERTSEKRSEKPAEKHFKEHQILKTCAEKRSEKNPEMFREMSGTSMVYDLVQTKSTNKSLTFLEHVR